MKLFLTSITFLIFIACSSPNEDQGKTGIVSVNDVFLSDEELQVEIPAGLSEKDSLEFRKQYILNWTKEQVVLQKAEEILPEESKDVTKRLEKYRQSLLIYTYEQAYLKDRLDTVVNKEEIETYYNDNKKEFTLKGFIVKSYYASFKSDGLDTENLNQWYLLKQEEDYINLNSFSQINALQYHLDTTNWIYFDEVLDKIPLENSIHKTSFIRHKRKINFTDNNVAYYLNIMDYRLKDELSPIAFETAKIKAIILNKRTQNLRRELSENLYNDALKNKLIKNYNKK